MDQRKVRREYVEVATVRSPMIELVCRQGNCGIEVTLKGLPKARSYVKDWA